jgi:hypothetical protein
VPRLVEWVAPIEILERAVSDVKGFAVEKYGIPPDFVISSNASRSTHVACHPGLVNYLFVEILKNATTALEAKFGAWDMDEAPSVEVTMNLPHEFDSRTSNGQFSFDRESLHRGCTIDMWDPSGLHADVDATDDDRHASIDTMADNAQCSMGSRCCWEVTVKDYAGGISDVALANCRHFFFSSVQASELKYGYSKDHGVTFSGMGVGLPMAIMYTEWMGGKLHLSKHTGEAGTGTLVHVSLPVFGFELR